MKKNIHPPYFEDARAVCSCGNVIYAGSTVKEMRTELCSKCHPFYTGTQKLVDTAGRVERYLTQVKTAEKKEEERKARTAKKKGKKIKIVVEKKE